ncbi:MAG: hypothetical protein Q9218_006616 [Villophora microphyllina]
MAQPNPPAHPAGHNKFIQVLQVTTGLTLYVATYPVFKAVRPLTKRLRSPVPNQVLARRSKRKDRCVGKIQIKNTDSVNERTGYMSLPAELRCEILGHVLEAGAVWPYGGLTAHKQWQRDFELATAAHHQAWKNFFFHPSQDNFMRAFEMDLICLAVTVGLEPPKLCTAALDTGPQVLSACRSIYVEGHRLFYSHNTFHVVHGPLSTASRYYDNMQPKHRRLIRKLVIDISPMDLTIEAFETVERYAGTNTIGMFGRKRNRLPQDDDADCWVLEAADQVINAWRSKLQWLRLYWSHLKEAEIVFFLTVPHLRTDVKRLLHQSDLDFSRTFKIRGRRLTDFLRAINDQYYAAPPRECYQACDKIFAAHMLEMELGIRLWLDSNIRTYGWKCFKAWLRQHAYEGPQTSG